MAGKAANRKAEPALTVRVWLFGQLAGLSGERPLVLRVAPGALVGEVIAELAGRLGSCLLDRVMETPERKQGICRLFLDGYDVELADRLPDTGAALDLELIVLTASEGG